MRKYTPTTSDRDAVGYVDLVLRVYRGRGGVGAIDRFPDGGKMSQYLESLPIGSLVDVKGPVGIHEYKGQGMFLDGKTKVSVTLSGTASVLGSDPVVLGGTTSQEVQLSYAAGTLRGQIAFSVLGYDFGANVALSL